MLQFFCGHDVLLGTGFDLSMFNESYDGAMRSRPQLLHIGLLHVAQISRLYHCEQRGVGEQTAKTRLRDDSRPPRVRIFDRETVLSELGGIGSH